MKYSIEFEGKVIEYLLKRSNRKTIGFNVDNKYQVVVTAPRGLNVSSIEPYVLKKAKWILEKLKTQKERNAKVPIREYINDEKFYILDSEYNLRVVEGEFNPSVARLGDKNIIVKIPEGLRPELRVEVIKQEIKGLIMDRGLEVAKERVPIYSEMLSVSPTKVVIKEQKSRWGSCSSTGGIYINWRIFIAPLAMVDYILVHELCHLIELNHSKKFWSLVKKILPDYREREQWITDNGYSLIV